MFSADLVHTELTESLLKIIQKGTPKISIMTLKICVKYWVMIRM